MVVSVGKMLMMRHYDILPGHEQLTFGIPAACSHKIALSLDLLSCRIPFDLARFVPIVHRGRRYEVTPFWPAVVSLPPRASLVSLPLGFADDIRLVRVARKHLGIARVEATRRPSIDVDPQRIHAKALTIRQRISCLKFIVFSLGHVHHVLQCLVIPPQIRQLDQPTIARRPNLATPNAPNHMLIWLLFAWHLVLALHNQTSMCASDQIRSGSFKCQKDP